MRESKIFEPKKDILEIARELSYVAEANRLDESEFESNNLEGYSAIDIQRDLDKVSRWKSGSYYDIDRTDHVEENEIIERGFEGAVLKAIVDMEIFTDSETFIAAKFDDYSSGVDTMTFKKSPKENEALGLSLDVTTGESRKHETVFKKVSKNFDRIINNEFCQPKYVLKRTAIKMQPKMPVGVIACSKENAVDFIRAVYVKDKKVISEFLALFISQYKLFLETTGEVLGNLRQSKDIDERIKATKALISLSEFSSYLENYLTKKEGVIAKKIPDKLLGDVANQQLEKALGVCKSRTI